MTWRETEVSLWMMYIYKLRNVLMGGLMADENESALIFHYCFICWGGLRVENHPGYPLAQR